MNIRALVVYRAAATAMIAVALTLGFMGAQHLSSPPSPGFVSIPLGVFGVLLAFGGLMGPARISTAGLKIPNEIQSMLVVLGWCLPIAGAALATSGFVADVRVESGSILVVAASAAVAAGAGLWPVSRRLPPAFTIGEMLAIMKSTGIGGKKSDSIADQEFRRWSQPTSAGVPVGESAPDAPVLTLDGVPNSLHAIFDEDDAPLVLNLGSYTCPHHRKRISELHALLDRWQPQGVRFLTVYTAEAHPEDGWKLAGQYERDEEFTSDDDFCFYQAKTPEDRLAMARWLIDKKHFRLPVVLDSLADGPDQNAAMWAYNSWPIRLYIIQGGVVRYSGDQGPFGYLPKEVDAALATLLQ